MKFVTTALAALLITGSSLALRADTAAPAGGDTSTAPAGSTAPAKGKWAKKHPRRHQVNKRLARQNKRIKKEVKEGELTKKQAAKLHKGDRKIRQEERDMASQNKGHITKQEQKTLNEQENKESKEIGK